MESHLQSGSGLRKRLVLKMNTTHSSSFAAEVPAYAQLQREMHDAVRAQQPDWILPNGDCPTCDSYDERFAELLTISLATERVRAHRPNNFTNRTKLHTFFVSHGGNATSPARDLDVSGNFGMPARCAQARKIVFPEMASAM
jgi:hypothetical protein